MENLAKMIRSNSSLRYVDLSDNMILGTNWRGGGTQNFKLLTELAYAVGMHERLKWVALLHNGIDNSVEASAVFSTALAAAAHRSSGPPTICYSMRESEKRAHLTRQAAYAQAGLEPCGRKRSDQVTLACLRSICGQVPSGERDQHDAR